MSDPQPAAGEPVPPYGTPPVGPGQPPAHQDGTGAAAGSGHPTYGTPPPQGEQQQYPNYLSRTGPQGPYGIPPQSRQGGRRRRAGQVGTAAAGGAAIAGKAGLLAKLFLAFKSFAILAKFKGALSLIISVGVYTMFWGWRFALGFVIILFVHEMGHVAVLRAQGVPASAPMFIPFLGAFVAVKGPQRSVAEEAWSAIAGPIVGAVGALVTLQFAELNGSLLLRALAYTAFLINLFNLIPALPLDGGRVAGALHPAVWWLGMAGAVVLLLTFHSPVMILVLVLGGMEVFRRWRRRQAGLDKEYYSVPAGTRLAIAAAYLGVAALCVYGMHISYVPRPA
jgi:Zn-dependent protease